MGFTPSSASHFAVRQVWAALDRPVRSDEVPGWLLRWMTQRWVTLIMAVALVCCGTGLWLMHHQHQQVVSIREQMLKVAELPAVEPPLTVSAVVVPDFTRTFPQYPDVAPVVGELQRSASSHGVTVQELQSHLTPASLQQLARIELTAQMRGNYLSIKQVLIDVLDRYPYASVRRFAVRRDTSPQDLIADVGFTVWGQPMTGKN